MPTKATTHPDAEALGRVLGCRVTLLGDSSASHNEHFLAVRNDGTRLFVKLMTSSRAYYDAEVAVSTHLAASRVPYLAHHGELGPGRLWLAYTWREIRPFTASPASLYEAGTALGELHARTRGIVDKRLRRYQSISDLLTTKIDLVAGFDPALADRLRGIRAHLTDSEAAFMEEAEAACLLHGDFGWRNLGHDDDGKCVLFDFEQCPFTGVRSKLAIGDMTATLSSIYSIRS